MRVLALEPYHGGSHRAFLDGWSSVSRHSWSVIGLPPHQWKWRMRHAPLTLSDIVNERAAGGESWDVLFCSDMLSLAEFKGLVDPEVAKLPAVAYFHENQLTYPVRRESERDIHFAFTNFTTARAADEVWFNSEFHRQEFLQALQSLLARMPDFTWSETLSEIKDKSVVRSQGISPVASNAGVRAKPPLILWAARWEHDKNPEMFFKAISLLSSEAKVFRVSVIGESFREVPPVFQTARKLLGERVVRWGYQENRQDYETALAEADIIVSTADHEFFGVSAVEAISAGAYPLLPHRLAYPEVLGTKGGRANGQFFYDGSLEQLVRRLDGLLTLAEHDNLWEGSPDRACSLVERYYWENLVPELDDGLDRLAGGDDSAR